MCIRDRVDSDTALSKQIPVRPRERLIPFLLQYRSKSPEVYCAPRSEWKITPVGGLRLAIAISKAAVTSSVRIWRQWPIRTSLREYKSITVATYAQPSHVFTYVISPHHFSLGRSAQKDRPIRSGAGTGLSPPMVVRFHAFGSSDGVRAGQRPS